MDRRYRFISPLKDVPIRLAGVISESIVDGPGVRFVVFVQGCPHHCEGCHNPNTHDFNGGTLSSTKELYDRITPISDNIDGLTFSGGEPFCQAEALGALGKRMSDEGKNIMTYTGYTFEELVKLAKNDKGIHSLLSCTNTLVDGKFILEQRDLTLKFRGSRNQRLLDITCYPNSLDYTVIE